MSVARFSVLALSTVFAAAGAGCSASSPPAGAGGALPGSSGGLAQSGGGAGAAQGRAAQGGSPATSQGGSAQAGSVAQAGSSSGGLASGGASGLGGQAATGGAAPGTGGVTSSGGSSAGQGGGSAGTGASPQGGSASQGGSPGNGGTAGQAQGGASGGQGGGATSNAACPAGPFTGSPLSGGSMMATLAGSAPSDDFNQSGNSFTTVEGPVWLGDALYFSEVQSNGQPPRSRILKLDSAGQVTQVYPKGGTTGTSGTNGLAVDANGKLFGANHQTGAITQFDLAAGSAMDLVTSFMGARFNSPNDLAFRSDGSLYFSDPNAWQAPAQKPQSSTRVYRVAKGSTTAVAVLDPSKQPSPQQPNGVTFSLDQNTLFVSGPEGVFSYPIQADGSLGTGTRLSSPSRGDGMTLDCAGNLYVTSDSSVYVLDATGKQLGTISVPSSGASAVTNVAFGGADHKTLYITAQGGSKQHNVFKLNLAIPGLPY